MKLCATGAAAALRTNGRAQLVRRESEFLESVQLASKYIEVNLASCPPDGLLNAKSLYANIQAIQTVHQMLRDSLQESYEYDPEQFSLSLTFSRVSRLASRVSRLASRVSRLSLSHSLTLI